MVTVLFEDSAAMLGLIIPGGGIFLADVLAMPWLDGAASVLIGVVFAGVATVLAIVCKGLLIREGTYPETGPASARWTPRRPKSTISTKCALCVLGPRTCWSRCPWISPIT